MISINIDKAKNITHEVRRKARAEEFTPHDEVIMKQLPGTAAQEAEAARQVIREKYAALQTQIDSTDSVDKLKNICQTLKTDL